MASTGCKNARASLQHGDICACRPESLLRGFLLQRWEPQSVAVGQPRKGKKQGRSSRGRSGAKARDDIYTHVEPPAKIVVKWHTSRG